MRNRISETDPRPNLVNEPDVVAQLLSDDGIFPNSHLPLLVYREAVRLPGEDPAACLEKLFAANAWRGSWRNGIYTYPHYHSTAHEVLGVFRGTVKVRFGGEEGVVHQLNPGDVVIIPAGVAHHNLGSSSDFGVVGAYPAGQDWDMNYGKPGERPPADEHIARVRLPKNDPVYGSGGPLVEYWAVGRARPGLTSPWQRRA